MCFRFIHSIFCIQLFFATAMFSQNIAVIGDFRSGGPGVDSVAQLVKSWHPDAIITTGDNYLLTDGSVDDQVGKYYSEFIYPYSGNYIPAGTSNTFYPALGNHDLDNSGLQQYLDYFTLPGNERYYQLLVGNVVFFIINSNTSEPDGISDTSVQALWLRNKLLLAHDYWKIVIFHHPAYTSGPHVADTLMRWPFRTWGADAVISGHNHGYERLWADSLAYFVNGAGGAPLYVFGSSAESQLTYSKNYGAQRIIANSDSIVFSFFNIRDSLVDAYTIKKPLPPPPSAISENNDAISRIEINGTELEITLKTDVAAQNILIRISNANGQTLITSSNKPGEKNKITVNIAGLKTGIYFVQLSGKTFSAKAKFAVVK
jgi:tartrate-resistant acid phosphatase type 5